MSLAAGEGIRSHRDYPTGLKSGMVRLHLPVKTNPRVRMEIGDQTFRWRAGDLWFGDFALNHRVLNDGKDARVHCVIDAEISPALVNLFPADYLTAIGACEILYHMPPAPLFGSDASKLPASLLVPAKLLDVDHPVSTTGGCLPAELIWEGTRLILVIPGEDPVELIHVGQGTFTLRGWYAERTIRLSTSGALFRSHLGRTIAGEVETGARIRSARRESKAEFSFTTVAARPCDA